MTTVAVVWRTTRTVGATTALPCGRGTQCDTMHSEQWASSLVDPACMWMVCTLAVAKTATRQTTAAIFMKRKISRLAVVKVHA